MEISTKFRWIFGENSNESLSVDFYWRFWKFGRFMFELKIQDESEFKLKDSSWIQLEISARNNACQWEQKWLPEEITVIDSTSSILVPSVIFNLKFNLNFNMKTQHENSTSIFNSSMMASNILFISISQFSTWIFNLKVHFNLNSTWNRGGRQRWRCGSTTWKRRFFRRKCSSSSQVHSPVGE